MSVQPEASELTVERAVQMLEASPDFRVLRRLVARDEFGGDAGAALHRAVVLDTETTGTDLESDQVIELGLVAFDYEPQTGQIVRIAAVYDSLEDPGMPIPAETTAIHGITDEMVAGQRIDDSAVAALVHGAQWIVAHNAAFDRPFVERRWPLFERLPWVCSYAQIPWSQEGFAGSKLEYLANRCGFFFEGHRSEIDCRALLEILRRPLPKSGQIAWHQLLSAGTQPAYRLSALDAPFESKDLLKARGYRWDAKRRCWNKVMDRDAAAAEAPWLKEHVYGGRSREVEIEILDAQTRFSSRPGKRIKRSV